ncbi:hypothetical protein D9758_006814 [Tetrapyrgos nigripes]|uniref:Uncharacterized protein n=1 Tax=Tetrapyrgos nigripes TaxID=182062 RepID=A0A8H5FU19_9AGAR|nr:hypothetical protein D9758_006814 [Tetrapyrgos nigripes]
MQRFKRVFTPKTSKKSPDEGRRRSKSFSSVPLSSSRNNTTDSKSSKHRGIQPSDITVVSVLDISAENDRLFEDDEESFRADDPNSHRGLPFVIDKKLLDCFPQPPPINSILRIPIYSTDYGLPEDEILPPLLPQVERYWQEQRAIQRETQVQASPNSRQPLSRSSNASFSRPTNWAYPSLSSQSSYTPTSATMSRASSRNDHNYAARPIRCNPLNHKKLASDPGARTGASEAQAQPHVLHHNQNRTKARHRPGPRQPIPENVNENGGIVFSYSSRPGQGRRLPPQPHFCPGPSYF